MKSRSSSSSTSHISLQLQWLHILLLIYFSPISINGVGAQEPVGYGYAVKSVGIDPTGRSFVADLELLRDSSVFGSDVPNLRLTARHVLNIMDVLGSLRNCSMRTLPQHYVLRRWTKKVKICIHSPTSGVEGQQRPKEYDERYLLLTSKMIMLATSVCQDNMVFNMVDVELDALFMCAQSMLAISCNNVDGRQLIQVLRNISTESSITADTLDARKVGKTIKSRPNPNRSRKRLRSFLERAWQKKKVAIKRQMDKSSAKEANIRGDETLEADGSEFIRLNLTL